MADEQNQLLEFYIFDISNERSFHLTNDSNDKRLIIFYNISNGLYTIGIRNGMLNMSFFLLYLHTAALDDLLNI